MKRGNERKETMETVRIINGMAITRMIGTHGVYHVRINEHKEVVFDTIKKAAKFIETLAKTGNEELAIIYGQNA